MVVLYRTAYPPVEYRNTYASFAMAFRALCLAIQFIGPLIVCVFYMVRQPNVRIDRERPKVTPMDVFSFSGIIIDGATGDSRILSWPDDIPDQTVIHVETLPIIHNDVLTEWTIKAYILGSGGQWTFQSVSLAFRYKVQLNRWTKNTVITSDTYSFNFPKPGSSVTAVGDLMIEQSEIVEFHGSFDNYWFPRPNQGLAGYLIDQDNTSSLFYVDWEQGFPKYGTWIEAGVDLRIRVKPLEIMHQIPLVSSLESVLLLYLSTVLLTTIVMNWIQKIVYRSGMLKTWSLRLYVPSVVKS
jgi:hypothetical protein